MNCYTEVPFKTGCTVFKFIHDTHSSSCLFVLDWFNSISQMLVLMYVSERVREWLFVLDWFNSISQMLVLMYVSERVREWLFVLDWFNSISQMLVLRDWPFNLKGGVMVFCFVQHFFFRQHELEYLFFLPRKARNFFPEFNIRLYDKNSESHYFFFPPSKSEYFFQQHWEPEYFFRKKP